LATRRRPRVAAGSLVALGRRGFPEPIHESVQ
jgi:hypothetical protein